MNQAKVRAIGDTELQPSSFLDYRLYFHALYEERKRSTPRYTYQMFASDLGFKATTIMHQIVKGYRPLTGKAAAAIAKVLKLDKTETQYLLALVAFCNAKTVASRDASFQKLQQLKKQLLPNEMDKDLLAYFADWYNPIIWELVGTRGFQADPQWIARKIIPHLKPAQVQESLSLLERLELIRYDAEAKTYVQTKNRVSSGHRIKGLALVSYHNSMIDHAKAALTSISGTRRDISAVTVSVNEETLQKLRAMVHAFQLQILDEAERSGSGDQVYQMNIQLFPFTE